MTDIVEKLHDYADYGMSEPDDAALFREAADEIERRRADNKRLRAALKPFAAYVDQPTKIYEHEGVRMALVDHDILMRLCRAAAAVLKETDNE